MPRDMFGVELGVGAFVAYPYATERSKFGIITNLGSVRATIDNGISKYYETLIECSDKITEEQKEGLRTRYTAQLNAPRKVPVPKFIMVRFRRERLYAYDTGAERLTDDDLLRFVLLESEDGTLDSITRKATAILNELNAAWDQNIPPYSRWQHRGYCLIRNGAIEYTRYNTWTSANMTRTKLFSANLPIHLNRILTLNDINTINAANR